MSRFRPCAVIPTFDNPTTIRAAVLAVKRHLEDVFVVDDGSGPEGRAACRALADEGLVRLHVRPKNGGKGAAVKDGLAMAHLLGFSHALQMDADLQHEPDDVPRFLAAGRAAPEALVLGQPVFDDSAPWIRLAGRQLTIRLVHLETLSRAIADPMCGFRLYPLAACHRLRVVGDAMDFDPEVAVRLYWRGASIVNLPTRVRYPEGGVSSFRQVRDNALLTWMHIRLCLLMPLMMLLRWRRIRTTAAAAPRDWLSIGEKGSVLGLRLLVLLATVGGRWLGRLVLRGVAAYFVAFHPSVRRASRAFHRRLEGREPPIARVYRHVLTFAFVALDRLYFARRRLDLFRFSETGREHLEALRARGAGALLIGGHLGSFEAMRAMSSAAALPLNVVGYFRNARIINAMAERLDPTANITLIEIEPDSPTFVFRIQACIERGELVAILGDRVGLGGGSATVDFLGAPAAMPTGPYALAAALGCPVYFTAGLYRGPNRYDLHCEPFAERVSLPRATRKAALAGYAQEFADRLARHTRMAPDNWFNFYDFWGAPASANDESEAPVREAV